jgi:hypothetical protein
MTTINGTSAIHARNESSKLGKERMSSMAVMAAAAHSNRVGNCTGEVYQTCGKYFSGAMNQTECDWSNRRKLTQKDRKRH